MLRDQGYTDNPLILVSIVAAAFAVSVLALAGTALLAVWLYLTVGPVLSMCLAWIALALLIWRRARA